MAETVKIVEWHAERIMQAVIEKIARNAPDAAYFIETDARRRLDAIRTPDTPRDRNYRFYLSKWMLTHVVQRLEGKALMVAVGMRIGKGGQKHHGWWIERGSSSAPAHPYLRPAVLQNARDIIELLIGD